MPGHERFLKNMLAGVGAIDACLFVVAAPEGWKPQSEEHLRILELLGVEHGLVALTKVGLVDAICATSPIWSSRTGWPARSSSRPKWSTSTRRRASAWPSLRGALDRLLATTPHAVDRDRPRLWIDRSFAPKGAGTVVTGTLAGGTLSVGDELRRPS